MDCAGRLMANSSFTSKIIIPDATTSSSGLMSAQDKKRLDALYANMLVDDKYIYVDSGRIPTGSQSESGYPPNTNIVFLCGNCCEVTLLPLNSLRHAQIFINGTNILVKFLSPEGISGYRDGFFLSAGEAITFVREPPPAKIWRAV